MDWEPLRGYAIYRSQDDSASIRLIELPGSDTTYTDADIRNGHRYEYYIVVIGPNGEGEHSKKTSATIDADPVVVIEGENVAETPTRSVELTIVAYGAEQMLLSNDRDFAGAVWEPFAATKQWLLETGAGAKTVYLKIAYASGDTSRVVSDGIEPAELHLSVVIAYGAAETPYRRVPIRISANRATQMQVSNAPLSSGGVWVPFAERFDWDLASGAGTKSVYVRVRSDFQIEEEATDSIEPAELRATLQILPFSLYINHTDVILAMPGSGATEMKLSNSPDSTRVEWQAYRSDVAWELEAGDGWKYVYVWFRNEFLTPTLSVDSIGLDTRAVITNFEWTTDGGDTLLLGDRVWFSVQTANDAFGYESGGTASVTVANWEPIVLTDLLDGVYVATLQITDFTPDVIHASVIANFTDRAGVAANPVIARNLLSKLFPAGYERDFQLGDTELAIKMCWIPPGTFIMGSQDWEQDRHPNEGPAHRVTFEYGFWISKFEITQLQWSRVMGSNPSIGNGVGDDYPVYNISWEDIQLFEERVDHNLRLPSEAEWEYACRSGTSTRFFWGDDPRYDEISHYAWCLLNGNGVAHPVGSLNPNEWGLADISGNLWELCEDWYHDSYIGAPQDGSAWIVPAGDLRVVRGGGWSHDAKGCRSARRGYDWASDHYAYGFRVVLNNH